MSKVRALENLRVLELTEGWSAAALCGKILAELGAELVKVERLEGDLLRKRKPLMEEGESYA